MKLGSRPQDTCDNAFVILSFILNHNTQSHSLVQHRGFVVLDLEKLKIFQQKK